MTIVAEPMSEEAVADHSEQTLANEDVVLRALRDAARSVIRTDCQRRRLGRRMTAGQRNGGCNGRSKG